MIVKQLKCYKTRESRIQNTRDPKKQKPKYFSAIKTISLKNISKKIDIVYFNVSNEAKNSKNGWRFSFFED